MVFTTFKKTISMKTSLSLLLFPLLLISSSGYAQTTFTNTTDLLAAGEDKFSQMPMAIVDIDGNGRDDLLRLENGTYASIEFQQDDGTFIYQGLGNLSLSPLFAVACADTNQDGWLEIISGGFSTSSGLRLLDLPTFSATSLPGPPFFVQGTNFIDINNDGHLDIFSCNDDGVSYIWSNDGAGTYASANSWIDMAAVGAGNYGSTWVDFDNDGDMDLYLSKCDNVPPSNPNRINALYVNDGSNNFTEAAADYNLKFSDQSWASDFQDIDNDGDLDCFVLNHGSSDYLLENDGNGIFTNITAASGITEGPGDHFQSLMRDLDNDGFVDIIVSGTDSHRFFHNNGNKTFTHIPNLFTPSDFSSVAIGDLNHDGFLDFYCGYGDLFDPDNNKPDILWMNDGNDNNWIAFRLQGVESNSNAVGARIEIFGDWGIQTREVRSGESYGVCNTLHQHFGLGTSSAIDSVIVRWPSGNKDKISGLEINTFHQLTEGDCPYPATSVIAVDGELTICPGDTTWLSAPEGLSYSWSTGDTTQSIAATEAGAFEVAVQTGAFCQIATPAIQMEVYPGPVAEIMADGPLGVCLGDTVFLHAADAESYLWSTGDTTASISATVADTYTVQTQNNCGVTALDTVQVEIWEAEPPSAEDVILTSPGEAILMASGENPHWYDQETGGILLGTGNEFNTGFLSSSAIFFVEDQVAFGQDSTICISGRAQVLVEIVTGTTGNGLRNDYFVHPNPADGFLRVSTAFKSTHSFDIDLYDLRGRQIYSTFWPVGTHELDLDLRTFPSGIYFLIIQKEDGKLVRKVILESKK